MTNTSVSVPIADLAHCLRAAVGRSIADPDAAERVSAQFLRAELRGKRGHGAVRALWLHRRLAPLVHQAPDVVQATPFWEVWNAASSVGYVVAEAAAEAVGRMVHTTGAGAVIVREAFPTGVLADYLAPLTEAGCLAGALALTPRMAAVTPGGRAVLGTHPFAVGVPGADGGWIADVSLAPTTFGSILTGLYPASDEDPAWADLPVEPKDPARPLMDEAMALGGRIAPPRPGAETRLGALLVLVDLIGHWLAGPPRRGHLVIAAVRPDERFDRAALDARLAALTEAGAMRPGRRGAEREVAARAQRAVALSSRLWTELQTLAASGT